MIDKSIKFFGINIAILTISDTRNFDNDKSGSTLIKLLPQEKIIFGCNCKKDDDIIIATKKGKFFKLKISEISNSHIYKMGYLNEKIKLKNDSYIKILTNNQYCILETNKEKIAKLSPKNIDIKSNKYLYDINFIKFQEDEYIKNLTPFYYL